MIKGTTADGFDFEVNENIAKDFRIVMATAKLSSENTLEKVNGTYDFALAVLGKSGLERLVDFTAKKKGFPETEYILSQTREILEYAATHGDEIKK